MCVYMYIIYLCAIINLHIMYIYFNINHLTQARAEAKLHLRTKEQQVPQSRYKHPNVRDGS